MDWWFAGALLGTLASPWISPHWVQWPWLAYPALLSVVLIAMRWASWARFERLRKISNSNAMPIFLISGLLCGMQWSLINGKDALSWNLPENLYRQVITADARIDSIVDDNGFRWRMDVTADESLGGKKLRLNWYAPDGIKPQLGEVWRFQMRLRPAVSMQNEAGFNYQAYLLRKGIRATGSVSEAQRISPASNYISKTRQWLYNEFAARRDDLSYADILVALAIAERSWMDSERWQVLQHTGVAHLMAISGLHLTMVFATSVLVIKWLLGLAGFLSGKTYNLLWPALLTAWLIAFGYAALAGFAVATMRALLLITLILILRLVGWRLSSMRLLLRAIVLLLLLDPMAWLDIGFWLSSTAVAAIFIWLWRCSYTPDSGWRAHLVQLWRLEVMLTLMLLPLTAVFFAGVSWLAPVTNLIAVPVFSVIILPLTLLAVLLLFPAPNVASALLATADTVLHWLWQFLHWAEIWAWWGDVSGLASCLVLGLILTCYLPVAMVRRFQLSLIFSLAIGLYYLSFHLRQFDQRLWVHMLDVGQGSALVIERAGRALLIDTGIAYENGMNMGEAVVLPFLQKRRLKLDAIFLTHNHHDHAGSIGVLQTRYPYVPVYANFGAFLPCAEGMPWNWQKVFIHILAPLKGPAYGTNNDGCVFQLTYQGQRILLPGDIERIAEFRLSNLYGERLATDVLAVPHHGSRTSSHRLFLSYVQPEWALISSGYLNRFNMPHPEALERLREVNAQVLVSGEEGQISMLWNGKRWQARTARRNFAGFWYNQLPYLE